MTNKSKTTFTFYIEKVQFERLDHFLAEQLKNHSRSKISKLIKNNLITVNGQPVKPSYKPEKNDRINVEIPPEKTAHIIPQKMDLDIIYEDEYFIAVNKPAGLSVHPGAGVTENTLVNGLLYYTKNLSQVGGSERPGLIHRLDKDTTGVLLVAKTDEAHWKMSEQFAERKIYKEYHTLVWGTPNCKGLIDQTIGRSSSDRKKFTVRDSGKSAITEFSILENWKIISLLKIQLHTGRTHQIRVHMKYCNSPVVGDSTYGNDNGRIKGFSQQKKDICQQVLKQANRQFLHARKLKFIHPFTDKTVEILAPLPADFENAIKILQHNKELLIGY